MLEYLFLQALPGGGSAPQGGQPDNNPLGMLLMVGGIIVVFYFFMIRPQQRKQKEEQKFRDSLKKGDKVVSIGGIYGRVSSVEDNGIYVDVDNNVKLKFDKTALRPAPEEQANAAKK